MIFTTSFNRSKVPKPYDVLELYRKCLPVGSVRLKIYETIIKRAQRKKMLPFKAEVVLEEVKTKLKKAIRETPYQKATRLEGEFEALEMRGKTHPAFKAAWEDQLDEMEEADMKIVFDVEALFRKYIAKLTDDQSCCPSGVVQLGWR